MIGEKQGRNNLFREGRWMKCIGEIAEVQVISFRQIRQKHGFFFTKRCMIGRDLLNSTQLLSTSTLKISMTNEMSIQSSSVSL